MKTFEKTNKQTRNFVMANTLLQCHFVHMIIGFVEHPINQLEYNTIRGGPGLYSTANAESVLQSYDDRKTNIRGDHRRG